MLFYPGNENNSNQFNQNLNFIELIWEKFQNLSLLSADLFKNINSKKNFVYDIFLNIQYSLSHESVKDLNNFYLNCLNNSTDENLRRYSMAIYVLLKIFSLKMDSELEMQKENILNEYSMILSTVKSLFTNPELRFNFFFKSK